MKNYFTIISDNGAEHYDAETYGEAMLYCYQVVARGMRFSTKVIDNNNGDIVFELDAKTIFKDIIRNNDHKKLGVVCCVTKKE